MPKYILFIALVSSLLHISLSFHECDRSINGTQIIFSCNLTTIELRLFDLSTDQLKSITTIIGKARDGTSTRGPFTSIPPNICLLPNLQIVDFSNNQIVDVDPSESLTFCLNNVVELNVANNNITTFPSVLIYNMASLKNLYFQGNQLTEVPANAFYNISQFNIIDFSYNQLTSFELWALEVQQRADFRFNQISTITNKYFFTDFTRNDKSIDVLLSNNTPTIEFTDAIYEMYGQCEDVNDALNNENDTTNLLWFSWKLAMIDFGTTQIKCGCDQAYIIMTIEFKTGDLSSDNPRFKIETTSCFNEPSKYLMDGNVCSGDSNSTVNFTSVYPRLCKIHDYEEGNTTNKPVIPDPEPNIIYPHYESALLNPGACFASFTSNTTMNVIRCSNEPTTDSSKLPDSLLDSPYMQGIGRIIFPSAISALPPFFCSLPSGQIDLRSNNFTTLTSATFPCLDSFKTIVLSDNKLSSVSTPRIDFQNLTSLDLSSNQLTELPYSILRPTPTSLRYLDLRNNSIRQLDLFIYTLKNITIYLDNNPIDPTNLTNTQNVTIDRNSTISVNITLPGSVTNSSTIIQDSTVSTFISCAFFTVIEGSLDLIRSTTNALLLCTCNSFTLKEIYRENGKNITDSFTCSNPDQLQSYINLNAGNCPNAVNIRRAPCNDTEISNNTTPTVISNSSLEYTSTSFTSNSSLITLEPSNQTEITSLSPNNTSSTSTVPGENSNSTGVTSPLGNETSSTVTTTPGGNSSSTGVTLPTGNDTSSTITTPGGNSSSTGVTLPTGNDTSSTVTIPGGNSSSTGVTLPTGNDTSSTVTTPGGNSSSTGVTLPTGNDTSSTNTAPGGNSSTTSIFTGYVTVSTSTTSVRNATVSISPNTSELTIVPSNTSTTPVPPVQSGRSVDSDNTRLIIGLVVGLVGGALVIGGLILAYFLLKAKSATAATRKQPIPRSTIISQGPNDHLVNRVQSRNLRSVRLQPLPSSSRPPLPNVPVKAVAPTTNGLLTAYPNSTSRTSAKGIPIRLDSVRSPSEISPQYPPNSNALNNSSSFRPINNVSTFQTQMPQQPVHAPAPSAKQKLNIGGDLRS